LLPKTYPVKLKKRKRTVKLKIDSWADRQKIQHALASSGYKVWVEYKTRGLIHTDWFICFEIKSSEVSI
jgi:hypothetical protein